MYDFTTLAPAWGSNAKMWRALEKQGFHDPDIIDFGVAEMKFLLAPEIAAATARCAQTESFGYVVSDDNEALQNAVCGWMERRHGWNIRPEWLCQSYGLVAGIGCALRAMTQVGDGVLVCFPSYGPFQRTVLANDRRLVRSDLVRQGGRWVMDMDDIEQKLAQQEVKVFILCNPHNPTGRSWMREELRAVGELCLRHGVKIISDEIHSDLVFLPHAHTVFASICPEFAAQTVTLTAPSKTFNIAGMTISNIITSNEELRGAVSREIAMSMGSYINLFGMTACRAAYDEAEPWLDELLPVLDGNAKFLRSFLNERLPVVKTTEQESTYLCWIDYAGLGLSGEALDEFLWKKAAFLSQRGGFFGEGYDTFHRVNVACPRAYLEKALQRLEAAARSEGLL